MASLLVPSDSMRGSLTLDRAAFSTTTNVPYFQLESKSLAKIMPALKKYILKKPQFKAIQKTEDTAIAYLDPYKVKVLEDIPEKDRSILTAIAEFHESGKLTLEYENWNLSEVLRAALPDNVEVPMSYSRVGHIVHLNLRESQLPFKNLIGQVYLDKTPNIRTVVNKTSSIDATYRFFAMEFLAGEEDTVVSVKENKFTFEFDFAKVYWNPRLSTEHEILVNFLNENDVMYDVFAGVGPFAVPAAKKGICVLANDLNPESYKWLQKNMALNRVTENFHCYNLDGREFIKTVAKQHLLERRRTSVGSTTGSEHFVMNLPAMAVEFLDAFLDCFSEDEVSTISVKPPTIHVYFFVRAPEKGADLKSLAISLVEEKLGTLLNSETLVDVHFVRNVAPNKDMMRVSFLLTEKILRNGEPAMKKLKVDDNNDVDGIAGNNGTQEDIK